MPDSAVRHLLVLIFGSGAVIVVVYNLFDFALAWFGAARTSVKAARGAASVARRTGRAMMRMRPVSLLVAVVVTAAMVGLQAVWLAPSYLIGNGLSWSFIGNRRGIGRGPSNGPDWSSFAATLHWDRLTVVVVCVAATYIVTTRLIVRTPVLISAAWQPATDGPR